VVTYCINNKAIVNYTSPAHSRNPFPSIGDAVYRQLAGGGPSHGHRQRAQKIVKIASAVPEIPSRTDRHADRQTDRLITILRNRSRGRSKKRL